MPCYVKDIVKLAYAEIGYKEEPNGGTKYAKFFDEKYPNFYNTKKNGAHWCDIFVDYLFVKCFGYKEALRLTCQPEKSCGAGCRFSAGYYANQNRFGKTPKQGAQVFFYNREGEIAHTGIVVGVREGYIDVIEGNNDNMVNIHSYAKSSNKIMGYGYPDYDIEKTLTDEEVAHKVIEGEYGNGNTRITKLKAAGYDPTVIQALVNKILEGGTEYKCKVPKNTKRIIIELE